MEQTALKEYKSDSSIISVNRVESGLKVKLQILPIATSYTLNQFGIFGKLDDGQPTLLAIFQNADGFRIPSSSEAPDFEYSFYAILSVSNENDFSFTVDPSTLVTHSTLEESLEPIRTTLSPLINIWDERWEMGSIDGTTGKNEGSSSNIRCIDYIPVDGDVYLHFPLNTALHILYYDANKAFISRDIKTENGVATLPQGCKYIRFRMNVAYGTTYNNDISINYPSNFTDYYPSRLSKVESRVTNRNLLDNPFFQINQRNSSGTNLSYGLDRWYGTYAILQDGSSYKYKIAFGSMSVYCSQALEPSLKDFLHGKTVTCSFMNGDGEITSGSVVYNKNSTTDIHVCDNGKTEIFFNGTHGAFVITPLIAQAEYIVAVKLELGSVSTLANDSAPNYAEELLKCQRYYQKYTDFRLPLTGTSASTSDFPLSIATPMRTTPSVKGTVSAYSQVGLSPSQTSTITISSFSNNAIVIRASLGVTYSMVDGVAEI